MATLLSASDLRERVTVQAEVRTPGTGGSGTVEWSDLATLWARVRPMRGSEILDARQVTGGTTYEVTVRYPLPAGVEVKTDSRLTWRGVVLHLNTPPAVDPARQFINILATEKEEAA